MKKIFLLFALSSLISCARNVDDIKEHANEIADSQGFNLKSYQGYEYDIICGGYAWFTATDKKDTTIIYQYAVQKWFGEYHIYELSIKNSLVEIK